MRVKLIVRFCLLFCEYSDKADKDGGQLFLLQQVFACFFSSSKIFKGSTDWSKDHCMV